MCRERWGRVLELLNGVGGWPGEAESAKSGHKKTAQTEGTFARFGQ